MYKRQVEKPSLHARRIFADAVVFEDDALAMAVRVFGSGNVLYGSDYPHTIGAVSYTHLRAHETVLDLVCRLLLEKKNQKK